MWYAVSFSDASFQRARSFTSATKNKKARGFSIAAEARPRIRVWRATSATARHHYSTRRGHRTDRIHGAPAAVPVQCYATLCMPRCRLAASLTRSGRTWSWLVPHPGFKAPRRNSRRPRQAPSVSLPCTPCPHPSSLLSRVTRTSACRTYAKFNRDTPPAGCLALNRSARRTYRIYRQDDGY